MRRRTFLHVAAGTAMFGAPSAGVAQRPAAPVVGYLGPSLSVRQHWLAAFRKGLGAEGFVEGQNLTIEFRDAGSSDERLPDLAADLVRRRVAAISTTGPPAALAAKRATQTIPIVFVSGGDPVQMGLVTSMSRPGGNLTGVFFQFTELVAKRLALLHELAPRTKRVAVLVNPTNPATAAPTVQDIGVAGRALGLEIQVFNGSTGGEIDAAFDAIERWRADAVFIGPDPLFNSQRPQLVTLAARRGLPASYFVREFVEAGGLMGYGPDVVESYRLAGTYVARILKGAKPGDLPVVQPTKYELVINLKTAKALGLTVPPLMLELADEVIE